MITLGLEWFELIHQTGEGEAFAIPTKPKKAFCPTGEGGGVDPTCSPGQPRRMADLTPDEQFAARLDIIKNSCGVKIVGESRATHEWAKEVSRGLLKVKKAGYGMPEEVVCVDEATTRVHLGFGGDAGKLPLGYFHPSHPKRIYIADSYKKKENAEGMMARDGYVVVHEMGHYHHKTLKNMKKWDDGLKRATAANLSKYASTHPAEFVAEAFAAKVYGIKKGKWGQKAIDDLYEEFGGP